MVADKLDIQSLVQRIAAKAKAPPSLLVNVPLASERGNSATPQEEKSQQESKNGQQIVQDTLDLYLPKDQQPTLANAIQKMGSAPAVPRQQESKDSSGTVVQQASFNEEGELHGPYQRYYPDGKLKEILSYKNGKLDGIAQSFDEEGQLTQKVTYKDGKMEGLAIFYKEGQKTLEATYENGKLHGTTTSYGPNGQPTAQTIYENGKKQGISIAYGDRGHKVNETPYKEGKKEGPSRSFYPSGQTISYIPYKEGLKEGQAFQLYENGKVHQVLEYHADQLVAEPKTYDQKERLMEKKTD